MDEQTMKDYIEDLLQERARLYEQIRLLEGNRDEWEKMCMAYKAHTEELNQQLGNIMGMLQALGGGNG